MKEETKTLSIRLPLELHKRVQAKAEKDKRSMNIMIQLLLEKAMDAEEEKDGN